MKYQIDEYVVEHLKETNKYYIYFKDSSNKKCKIEIDKEIYDTYLESKKIYTKIKNQNTRYNEQSVQTEINLYKKAFHKPKAVEEEIIEKIELEKLQKAKEKLTETQKRRIELHIENGMTIDKIAKLESVCRTKIDKSIIQALKKLRKSLK